MTQTEEEKRDKYLQRTYGITSEEYDKLLAVYGGGCWICGKKAKNRRLHVEHDHKTKVVRGITCWSCNKLLKMANDSAKVLFDAADYVEDEGAQVAATLGRELVDA